MYITEVEDTKPPHMSARTKFTATRQQTADDKVEIKHPATIGSSASCHVSLSAVLQAHRKTNKNKNKKNNRYMKCAEAGAFNRTGQTDRRTDGRTDRRRQKIYIIYIRSFVLVFVFFIFFCIF